MNLDDCYFKGYEDGENSMMFDWTHAIREYTNLFKEDEEITIEATIRRINERRRPSV